MFGTLCTDIDYYFEMKETTVAQTSISFAKIHTYSKLYIVFIFFGSSL